MFVVRRLRVDEQECQKAQAEQRQEPTDGDGSDHQGTVAAGERLRMVPRSGGGRPPPMRSPGWVGVATTSGKPRLANSKSLIAVGWSQTSRLVAAGR